MGYQLGDCLKQILMDISSFLLVEGSADSEADCELLNVIMGCEYVDGDDDDAESCSCDSSYRPGFLQVFDSEEEEEEDDFDGGDGDKNIQFNNQNWRSSKMWLGDGEAESKDGTDLLSKKMVDQTDDRLFWETCMAEGYP